MTRRAVVRLRQVQQRLEVRLVHRVLRLARVTRSPVGL